MNYKQLKTTLKELTTPHGEQPVEDDDGSGRESPVLDSSTSTAAPEGGESSPETSPRGRCRRAMSVHSENDDDDSSMEDRSTLGGRPSGPVVQDILHSSIAVRFHEMQTRFPQYVYIRPLDGIIPGVN